MTTSIDNAPETFDIPEPRFAELEKRVERLARRAAKLGQAAVAVEVVGEKTVPVLDDYDRPTGRVRVFKVVQVIGSAPTVAGFTFVARVEHTTAGNIISKAPGCKDIIVPNHIRDGKPTCDHCKTRRARKDTFVLMGEDGILTRVGRNCLADFLRGEDAAEALRLWTLIHDVRRFASMSDEEGFGGGGSGFLLSVLYYVACAFRAVAVKGWVSRGQVWDEGTGTATANTASFAAGRAPQRASERQEWEELQPTEVDAKDAKAAIEWAKSLEGKSDYEHNLKVATTLEYVEPKNMGLVASVTIAFRRFQEREVARARAAERAAKSPSTHFGVVDVRYVRKLTVVKTLDRDNEWGLTVLYTMEDETGNVFKWWASGGCRFEGRPLAAGAELFFTFTVKRHGDYQGLQETTIFRTTPSKDEPSHKWVGSDGQIFKTKKAMVAAAASEAA